MITKLKSLSVFLSFCLTVRLSVGMAFYLSDILLTFWTTSVLITKLKTWKSHYVCNSVCLPGALSIFLHVCLSDLTFWHPVNILNNFCFDNYAEKSFCLSICLFVFLLTFWTTFVLTTRLKSLYLFLFCLFVFVSWHTDIWKYCFPTSCWHSTHLFFG